MNIIIVKMSENVSIYFLGRIAQHLLLSVFALARCHQTRCHVLMIFLLCVFSFYVLVGENKV